MNYYFSQCRKNDLPSARRSDNKQVMRSNPITMDPYLITPISYRLLIRTHIYGWSPNPGLDSCLFVEEVVVIIQDRMLGGEGRPC